MIFALKSLFRSTKPWQDEIQELYKTLVPLSGEAETLQGELVRSIQNLADECHRNGWMNWDDSNEDEIRILKRHLNDPNVFSGTETKLLLSKIEQIQFAGEKGADQGQMGYDEIKFVAERVVLWCRKNRKAIRKESDKNLIRRGLIENAENCLCFLSPL